MKIKDGKLFMYNVDEKYREYLRNFDAKVSFENNRKFYGILITENNIDYCIPFTSQVKKKNSKLTINIKNKNKIIAQLLINNMIPVNDNVVRKVIINNEKQKDFFNNEIIYLRNKEVLNEIILKTSNVINVIKDKSSYDYIFFKKICCDFILLEQKCKEYEHI